ncbi:class I SAM-dependent methyltransferase [Candidatus Saccharibacteria bacterium]|nr:class I SAM-dependent methyltransferase [Candidatus Saccharibacteria bacterium]
MDKWIYDKLSSRLSHFKGLIALDLGCGEGFNAVGLAKLGIKVTAVDKQATMIERIQELANKEKVTITTEVVEIQDFQPNTRYDIVLFTHVLHFIPSGDREYIIKKVVDLVKTGGLLVFADLEDDFPVLAECLSLLETSLKDIKTERFSVKDEPHLGADYPHHHKAFYLIGIKQ